MHAQFYIIIANILFCRYRYNAFTLGPREPSNIYKTDS